MKKFRLLLGVIAMLCVVAVNAQTKKFEATVVDELGEPCIGASVIVKGTTQGVMTNIDGSFSIDVPVDGEVEISYIGYVTQTISNFAITQITLEEDRQQIEEVVVVGYGVQKKSHLTGSIATVPMDDIQDLSSGDVASTLKGLMPGVSVSGGDTRPGESASITVRGNDKITNIGGSTQGATPLYVIDGYIYPNDVKAGDTTGINLGAEAFNNLDPTTIESITVLKDASAAVYGSRAASGVILVTTKKGKQGAPQVSYSGNIGIADSWSHPSMLNAYQYGQMYNAITYATPSQYVTPGSRNARTDIFQADELEAMKSLNYNLLDQYWRTAITHKHSFNLTGATEKVNYFAGVSYFDQDGNLGKLDYNRWTYRAGVEAKIGNNLKVGITINGDYGKKSQPYLGLNGTGSEADYTALLTHPRYIPEYVNDHALLTYGPKNSKNDNLQLYHFNQMQNNGDYKENMSSTLNVGANIEYDWSWIKPLKGLTMKFTYSKSISTDKTNEFGSEFDAYYMSQRAGSGNHLYTPTAEGVYGYINPATGEAGTYEELINDYNIWGQFNNKPVGNGEDGGVARRTMSRTDNYQINFNVAYARDFGKNSLSALFSMERSEAETEWMMAKATHPYIFGTHQSNSISEMEGGETDGRFTRFESGALSYIGRINYAYDDKYLLEFLIRSDASTKFAPGNYWGLFPSVSAGWVISKERWMQNASWLDFLKLRASFGLTGRDNITAWQWMQTYGTDADKGAIFGTANDQHTGNRITMSSQNSAINPDVHWDKSYKMNVGIDWNVLRNRLGFGIDFWRQWDREMLITLQGAEVPGTVGSGSAPQNIGEMDAWGVEFSVSWRDKINSDMSYRVSLNTGYSDNSVRYMEWATGASAYMGILPGGRTDTGLWGMECIGMFQTPLQIQEYFDTYLKKDDGTYGTYMGNTLDQMRPGMLMYKDVGSHDENNNHVNKPDHMVSAEDDMVRMAKFKSNPYGVTANLGFDWKSFSVTAQLSASWGGYATYNNSYTSITTSELEYMSLPSFWTVDNMFVYEAIKDAAGRTTVERNREGYYPNLAFAGVNKVASTFWKYSTAQVSLSRLTIAYSLPKKWMNAIGIQSCRINVTGQNLVNFINPYPDKFMNATTGNSSYYYYPRLRKITLGLNITF